MSSKLNDLLSKNVFGSDRTVSSLSKNSYANFFNVVNKGENSYFNISKGINFSNFDSLSESYYSNYITIEEDCWTNISYKCYGTIELWWLICKFNNIKNPFDKIEAGTILRIPNDEVKDMILDVIKAI